MNNISFEGFYPMFSVLINYWYISLPAAIALLFGSRWFPKIVVSTIGFFAGMFLIFPLLLQVQFIGDYISNNPSSEIFFQILTGLVVAAIVYSIFKFVFFVGGFIFGAFIGMWLWKILFPSLTNFLTTNFPNYQLPDWVYYAFIGILGLIIGLLAIISQEKTMVFISIISGAMIIMFLGVYGLLKLTSGTFGSLNNSANGNLVSIQMSTWGVLVFFVGMIILMFIGFRISYRPHKH